MVELKSFTVVSKEDLPRIFMAENGYDWSTPCDIEDVLRAVRDSKPCGPPPLIMSPDQFRRFLALFEEYEKSRK